MNDITIFSNPAQPLSAVELRHHKNLVAAVMKSVMQPEVHYGKIPGTPKPSLYQAGADCLMVTFHIAPTFRVEDLSGNGVARYRVTCIGTHQGTGVMLGEGVGECSSNEEKFKWRKAVCLEEFENTPETHRRRKYGSKKDGGFYTVDQVRTSPADFANSALKMAAKRAKVAMVLNVTAASDIFTQDVEDLPEGHTTDDGREGGSGREPISPPKSKSQAAVEGSSSGGQASGKANDGQIKYLKQKAGSVGIDLDALVLKKSLNLSDLSLDGFQVLKDALMEAERSA